MSNVHKSIQDYCEKEGYRVAQKIDYKMALIVKPKPFWCPSWLYKKIINSTVEVMTTK